MGRRRGERQRASRGHRPPLFAAALLLAAALAPATGRAGGTACKLALVLALDISSSVNPWEYAFQIQGLARAFRQPTIADAILSPEGASIAVTVFEWSGYSQQDIVVPWTMLDSEAAIAALADRLAAHQRPFANLATALGKAVEFGARLFGSAPPCARRVIDVSGDGVNNDGVGPEYFRERGLFEGMTINGLVIDGATPSPVPYYRQHVVQGPGAFLMVAEGYHDYPAMIAEKLLREIDQEMMLGEAQ